MTIKIPSLPTNNKMTIKGSLHCFPLITPKIFLTDILLTHLLISFCLVFANVEIKCLLTYIGHVAKIKVRVDRSCTDEKII